MKFELRTIGVRLSAALAGDLQRRLAALDDLLPITAAGVVLSRNREESLPHCVAVHLHVSGPDLHAAAREHTLAAALLKVERDLREQIALRQGGRLHNQKNRDRVRPVPACGR